jgi:hypothetical protein
MITLFVSKRKQSGTQNRVKNSIILNSEVLRDHFGSGAVQAMKAGLQASPMFAQMVLIHGNRLAFRKFLAGKDGGKRRELWQRVEICAQVPKFNRSIAEGKRNPSP